MNWYKTKKIADSTIDLYQYLCAHPVVLSEEDIFDPNIEAPEDFHIDQVQPGMWAGFAPHEARDVMLVAPEPIRENTKTMLKRRVYFILLDLQNYNCPAAI